MTKFQVMYYRTRLSDRVVYKNPKRVNGKLVDPDKVIIVDCVNDETHRVQGRHFRVRHDGVCVLTDFDVRQYQSNGNEHYDHIKFGNGRDERTQKWYFAQLEIIEANDMEHLKEILKPAYDKRVAERNAKQISHGYYTKQFIGAI